MKGATFRKHAVGGRLHGVVMPTLTEHSPPRPGGHEYLPGRTIVGWGPCNCGPDRPALSGGHRAYRRQDCDVEIHLPVCFRKDRTVRGHGIGT